jgi:hypothetical protein
VQESHRLEVQELERKLVVCRGTEGPGGQREITPEVHRALREDLDRLEQERDHLRSMQVPAKYYSNTNKYQRIPYTENILQGLMKIYCRAS